MPAFAVLAVLATSFAPLLAALPRLVRPLRETGALRVLRPILPRLAVPEAVAETGTLVFFFMTALRGLPGFTKTG
ncbi:MAG TPA: hypothetical protein VGL45_11655 [Bradyrhizobium sp.]